MNQHVIKTLGALILGIAAGVLLLILLALAPIRFDSPLYTPLGIKKPQVVGFQPYWLLAKADKEGYSRYLTTLTYFGLVLDTDGTIVRLANPQEEEPGWTTLKGEKLKEYLTKIDVKKSLLLHNANEASIAALLAKPEEHADNLVRDIAPLMKKYGFTDLNLDVESFQAASESAQMQFTAFVRQVRKGIDREKLGTLTVELTPISFVKQRVSNPQAIGELADYVVLMAYDFHYRGSYLAGPVSPIGGAGSTREFDIHSILEEAVKRIPSKKILLGIPLYGYEWETLGGSPGAATIPAGASTASHRRITELLGSCPTCTRGFDEVARQPYIVFPDGRYFHQIYYDDEASIAEKLSLATEFDLGGVAVWALGYEGEKLLEPVSAYKRSVQWSW